MPSKPISVIAQLLYVEPPLLNFARLVADLQSALQLGNCPPGKLTWEFDDLAMLDMGGTRFVLSLATAPEVPCAACLTVSVGPALADMPSTINVSDRVACERIVQRILRRSSADRIMWHEADGVVDAALIDDLVSHVPVLDLDTATTTPLTITALTNAHAREVVALTLAKIPDAEAVVDNRHPDDIKLANARAALWPIEPATASRTADRLAGRGSIPMRLATHSLDATLLVAALPVGAAMITLSMVRGANTRLSARAMVLTGSVMAVLGGPIPGSLASFG